jgi:tungstate transport system substrate-binding protein
MKRGLIWILTVVFVLFMIPGATLGTEKALKMSTTTSTENSGLLDLLLPEFTGETGIRVKVFAKGTGAAIRDGMDGNVDIIFVHAKGREEKFVADGYGAFRLGVMHNDFIILGPGNDPAGIRGMKEAAMALRRIADKKAKFVSRGDDSGTHTKEQALWKSSGLELDKRTSVIVKKGKKREITFIYPKGSEKWYFSIGQGMGKTITFAEEKQAYTLTDRGTYLKYKYGRSSGLDLQLLSEDDAALANPYGVIPINPKKHAHTKIQLAEEFAGWLVSERGQTLIKNYKLHGKQLFYPDAIP